MMVITNAGKASLVGLQTVATILALFVGIIVLTGASLVALVPAIGEQLTGR